MQNAKPAQPVAAPLPFQPRDPLTEEEIEGIVLAVKSAFLKLKNLCEKITPVFEEYAEIKGVRSEWHLHKAKRLM